MREAAKKHLRVTGVKRPMAPSNSASPPEPQPYMNPKERIDVWISPEGAITQDAVGYTGSTRDASNQGTSAINGQTNDVGGSTDGGTSDLVFGTMLNWL